MLKYQVSWCNQIGLKMFLFLVLIMVSWQALSPQPAEATQLINDKLGHALVFLFLAFLTDHAFATTPFNWHKALWLMLYGIAIEVLQHYIPGREFSLLDMAADASGLLIYFILTNTIIQRTPTPPRELKN
jgi:VanZ family protein